MPEAVVGRVTVLDVGHGNACVIESGDRVVVVDTGREEDLLLHLLERDIFQIDHLILSHGDEDHIGGGYWLLTDARFAVRNVYYNAEQFRDTGVYKRLCGAAKDAEVRKGTQQGSLTRGTTLRAGGALIEVLHPSHSDVAVSRSVGKANSLSIMLRVSTSMAGGIVFLAGDGDGSAVLDVAEFASARLLDPSARFLVFPHHGSAVAASRDISRYVASWLSLVRPTRVIFSTRRSEPSSRWRHPDPLVVREIVEAMGSDVQVMCTQLAAACCSDAGIPTPVHITVPGNGMRRQEAGRFPCAGTAVIDLRTGNLMEPSSDGHEQFKDGLEQPMCR